MKIKYSPHARIRMKQREVNSQQVRLTLLHPDYVLRTDRNRFIARRKLNGRSLEVVYVDENNQIVIITLYYEKSITKN